ncbi:HDIG domain-containing protein [Clostridia bacterium]|nr:HDIG domain-containing protein [Clostridia bacterium]
MNYNEHDLDRNAALDLLARHNKEEFHILHSKTMEGVMRYFADALGYSADADFWANVGLLHDVDFEESPEAHCVACQQILREAGYSDDFVRAVACHGYGISADGLPEPAHTMEKILFATDELTGLIGAVARMRPSKSVSDLETSSVMKKFKTPKFAAGCSRDVIQRGADMLGYTLEELIDKTILALRIVEPTL